MGEMMPDLLPRRQSEVYAHHTPHIGRLAPSLRADSPSRHRYGLGACPRGCAPNGVEVQLPSRHCGWNQWKRVNLRNAGSGCATGGVSHRRVHIAPSCALPRALQGSWRNRRSCRPSYTLRGCGESAHPRGGRSLPDLFRIHDLGNSAVDEPFVARCCHS